MPAIRRVVQFAARLQFGDAVSDEVLAIQRALRAWGYRTAAYGAQVTPRLRREVYSLEQFQPPREHWMAIYHHSIASEVSALVRNLHCPGLMIYHNITPAEYFYGTNDLMAELARKGRADLASLAPHFTLGLAHSEFSRADLEAVGFRRTGVLPLIIDFDKYRTPANPDLMRLYGDGRTNVLCVGRVAPNKRQEDVVKAFKFYKELDPDARLILVGSDETTEAYRRWLDDLIMTLQVADVIFTGRVELGDVVAYYQTAHVLVSMSEHEGFGVPLVEAMRFGVPIVAFASSAVPETLAGSGVLVKRKEYAAIAATVYQVTHDDRLRRSLIARARQRLSDIDPTRLLERLREYVDEIAQSEPTAER